MISIFHFQCNIDAVEWSTTVRLVNTDTQGGGGGGTELHDRKCLYERGIRMERVEFREKVRAYHICTLLCLLRPFVLLVVTWSSEGSLHG